MKNNFTTLLQDISTQNPELKYSFYYQEWETDFLRFFNSEVNYNISNRVSSLGTTIYKGKKKYSFYISNPDENQLRQNIEKALSIIDQLPDDPDFVDIEDNLEVQVSASKTNNIDKVTLSDKLDILKRIAESVKEYGFNIYGTFICNYETNYIINSNGVNKKYTSSPIMLELKAVSLKNEVTVIESFGSEDISTFDLDSFIEGLVSKVNKAGKEVIDVEPGNYEVILAPRCIAELMSYLVWGGMTAAGYDRKTSYFENKLNTKMFPEHITIVDDPKFPGIISVDYNSEGHIYNKVALIENGVFKNFVVDNYYGHKTGLKKNGSEANCLVLKKGDKELPEMISSVKKGLYISNLHYINFINMKETSITGLTRDGTFYIEDGEMKKVVNNLRFTVKITDIINNITELENKYHLTPTSDNYGAFDISSSATPHVKVSAFKITSSTKTI
ncbi:MAG: TldD/PmbA family protein [Candidatus Cloacimonadia bacterium]